MKQIEIDINGNVFVAKLLEKKAPGTCRELLSALPLDGLEGYHCFWSGESIQTHDAALRRMAGDSGLWPDTARADSRENTKFNGVLGEVGFYPRGSINITYGQARLFRPPMEVEPNYIFSRIGNTKRLYAVGGTFWKKGAQKISIKLVT